MGRGRTTRRKLRSNRFVFVSLFLLLLEACHSQKLNFFSLFLSLFEPVISGSAYPLFHSLKLELIPDASLPFFSLNVHDTDYTSSQLPPWIRCDARLFHSALHLSWPTSVGRASATIDLTHSTGEPTLNLLRPDERREDTN